MLVNRVWIFVARQGHNHSLKEIRHEKQDRVILREEARLVHEYDRDWLNPVGHYEIWDRRAVELCLEGAKKVFTAEFVRAGR